jgi:hypothetical protein
MNAARVELLDECLQFAVPHHGIAAYERNVQRLVLVDDGENAGDEFLAAEIGEFAQPNGTSQVSLIEGIAARAAQRALLGYFN